LSGSWWTWMSMAPLREISCAAAGMDRAIAAANRAACNFILFPSPFSAFDVGADMAGIFWTVDLYHKTVGIVELETFVIATRTRRDGKPVRRHLAAHRLGVPAL